VEGMKKYTLQTFPIDDDAAADEDKVVVVVDDDDDRWSFTF
jgi:hypothetical protein